MAMSRCGPWLTNGEGTALIICIARSTKHDRTDGRLYIPGGILKQNKHRKSNKKQQATSSGIRELLPHSAGATDSATASELSLNRGRCWFPSSVSIHGILSCLSSVSVTLFLLLYISFPPPFFLLLFPSRALAIFSGFVHALTLTVSAF